MKTAAPYFFFLFAVLLLAFSTIKKPSKELIGKWKIEQVTEHGNDITMDLNPNSDRWIQFHKAGTFESGGTPFGKNTGSFTIDDAAGTLFLDSDAGEDDDSNWKISFEKGRMIWNGIGSERQENTFVIYKSVKE